MAGHDQNYSEGPYFDELTLGQTFPAAPSVTLSEGMAAVHQAIVGDRLRLPLDAELARAITGRDQPLAHPALVWNVAIGQSTVATQHVVANLYYRGLAFRSAPRIGDTITTSTEVTALRMNRPKSGRRPTGMAELRIRSSDQHGREVLDFRRCAMLPLRDPNAALIANDAPTPDSTQPDAASWREVADQVTGTWDLTTYRTRTNVAPPPTVGTVVQILGGDVVSSSPELARLTLNIAAVHHDERAAGGRRLVYGGHTIAIALSQVTRAWPGLVTVLAWESCDHLAPVHEGDTLQSTVEVVSSEQSASGSLVTLRSMVAAADSSGSAPRDVLDWRFVALF